MIRTAADLFEELRRAELQVLREHHGIGHQGMIGDMYEGLASTLIERVIPAGVDLRVVRGKVRNEDGTLSGQMDVMVVTGDGERLPYTEHFLYPAEQVIAVIEVKKTLTGTELVSACEILKSVGVPSDDALVPVRQVRSALRAVAGLEMPRDGDEVDRMSPFGAMLFHSLMQDAMRPLRIVLGFDGFRTEFGLRESLLDYLEANVPTTPGDITDGFGPGQLPNLILSGEQAIVKLNGMPLAAVTPAPEVWVCFGSATRKSAPLLLEVLWTRIASRLPEIAHLIGDELTVEGTTPLLFAEARSVDGAEGARFGWQYIAAPVSRAELRVGVMDAEWAPIVVAQAEQRTLWLLAARRGRMALDDESFVESLASEGIDRDEHLRRLALARLIWIEDGKWLRSLADTLNTVFLPDGRIVVADAADPRLHRWIESQRGGE